MLHQNLKTYAYGCFNDFGIPSKFAFFEQNFYRKTKSSPFCVVFMSTGTTHTVSILFEARAAFNPE